MFKKLCLTVLVLVLMVGVSYACTGNDCDFDSNVQDTNDGNRGYIFTYCGEKGNNSLGTWVDPSFLKGEKGDKGDTGATGLAGRDGLDGINGIDGEDGLNGTNGINGVDGKGGAKGDTGSQGEQGIQGVKGDVGLTGATGEKGNTGDTGSKGDEGKEGKKGEQGKGLEDRYEVIGEIRVLDTRKTTTSIYAGRDINNDVNIVGIKFTYKLGQSYYEKKINELESKINNMDEQTTQTIVKDKNGDVVSMSISNTNKNASFIHSF